MTHTGDNWQRKCARRTGTPAIRVGGRRSIFSAWPPGATCEKCDREFESAYAGPASGDWIEYPAPEMQFVCESCARSILNLGDRELYGLSCQDLRRGDALHVTVKYYSSGTFEQLTNTQRIDQWSPEFTEYGWKVVKIEQSLSREAPDAIGKSPWDIWIQPRKDLPW